MAKNVRIGILALQGAFAKHEAMLRSLDAQTLLVRKPEDLNLCDGLIIPGGESTTIFRQMHFIKMEEALSEFAKEKPVFGTCAGLIIMSKKIVDERHFKPFALLDVTIERNAFGPQIESFSTELQLVLPNHQETSFPSLFIRAPRITEWGNDVNILAYHGSEPVLVQQGIHLGACFHPELSNDSRIHEYFLSLVKN